MTAFSFQVYKIQNSELEDERAVFLAANGLYEIIKNERLIMGCVSLFKADEIEEKFNKCVEAAVNDYNVFCANVQLTPSAMEIELLTNFIELFELVIDIKKSQAEKSAEGVAAAIIADAALENERQRPKAVIAGAATAVNENEFQPTKAKRARN